MLWLLIYIITMYIYRYICLHTCIYSACVTFKTFRFAGKRRKTNVRDWGLGVKLNWYRDWEIHINIIDLKL